MTHQDYIALVNQANRAFYEYYVLSRPSMSDADFDKIIMYLSSAVLSVLAVLGFVILIPAAIAAVAFGFPLLMDLLKHKFIHSSFHQFIK